MSDVSYEAIGWADLACPAFQVNPYISGKGHFALRARMARVEELTGMSLDVAENRALFLLALISRPRGQDG